MSVQINVVLTTQFHQTNREIGDACVNNRDLVISPRAFFLLLIFVSCLLASFSINRYSFRFAAVQMYGLALSHSLHPCDTNKLALDWDNIHRQKKIFNRRSKNVIKHCYRKHKKSLKGILQINYR